VKLWLRDIKDDIKGFHLDFFWGGNSLSHGSGKSCNDSGRKYRSEWEMTFVWVQKAADGSVY